MDLSGKLIIKAQLGDDLRRIPIHNEDITYDELILMMQRVFKQQLSNDDDLLIKYKDEDGDFITIADESDLSFAIQANKVLQIKIFVKNSTDSSKLDDKNGLEHRLTAVGDRMVLIQELCRLRDQITSLVDNLQSCASSGPPGGQATVPQQNKLLNGGHERLDRTKEFDPLSATSRQQLSHALSSDDTDRSTPNRSTILPNKADDLLPKLSSGPPGGGMYASPHSAGEFSSAPALNTDTLRTATPSSVHGPAQPDSTYAAATRPGLTAAMPPTQQQQHQQQAHTTANQPAQSMPPFYTAPRDPSSQYASSKPFQPPQSLAGQPPSVRTTSGAEASQVPLMAPSSTQAFVPPPLPGVQSAQQPSMPASGPPTMGPYGRPMGSGAGRPASTVATPPLPPTTSMFSPAGGLPSSQDQSPYGARGLQPSGYAGPMPPHVGQQQHQQQQQQQPSSHQQQQQQQSRQYPPTAPAYPPMPAGQNYPPGAAAAAPKLGGPEHSYYSPSMNYPPR